MKSYYKKCKNTKQVNTFLRQIGLGEFMQFDIDYTFPEEFDLDTWMSGDENEKHGVSIQVHPSYEIFVNKYTRKEIERINNELLH